MMQGYMSFDMKVLKEEYLSGGGGNASLAIESRRQKLVPRCRSTRPRPDVTTAPESISMSEMTRMNTRCDRTVATPVWKGRGRAAAKLAAAMAESGTVGAGIDM
jgi:hypothetical protein